MRASPELELHYAVADLLRRTAVPGLVWWHSNNTVSSVRYATKLKRMGVLAGVADFTVLIPRTFTTGMPMSPDVGFLELKSEKGRVSDAQKAFRATVEPLGCFYEVARTFDDAEDFLRDIGAIRTVSSSRLSIKQRAA